MNFTNLASFAAVLVASVQAAKFPVCSLPTTNSTGSDNNPTTITSSTNNSSVNTGSTSNSSTNVTAGTENKANAVIPEAGQTPSRSISTTRIANIDNVTPNSSIDEKVSKIMSLGTKFGDLDQAKVQSFLTAEEWGRIDYHYNDDPLSEETLKMILSKPSTSLTIAEKADRIMALNPTPKKMGDLKAEMVADILTPEEWGKIDFVDNEANISKELIVRTLAV